ncbi:MAG: peptide chain release factor N(5)-glutamine methyltransferase [Hespellia sp.]|nr:peptide chain release factor N(5)-glutamine methyltransferase [Hespellia sp.]
MTVKELYMEGTAALAAAGIEENSLDAWLLLEHLTGWSRARYFMDSGECVEEKLITQYRYLIRQREAHIPLQHLTGVQEFMGLEFLVNNKVLIPRQDTELLVEQAMTVLHSGMDFLDLCTGSGCIAISLCHYAQEKEMEKVTGVGADISKEALEIAEANKEKLRAPVRFIQSDLFENVEGPFDLIVSNPPYIRTSVIEELKEEVKCHDPFLALDGREDGLFFYRKIVRESARYMKRKGSLMVEIGHDQGAVVAELFEAAGYKKIQIKKDLAGLDRVVLGVYDKK